MSDVNNTVDPRLSVEILEMLDGGWMILIWMIGFDAHTYLASNKSAMTPAANGAAADVPWKPILHCPSISGTSFQPQEMFLIRWFN